MKHPFGKRRKNENNGQLTAAPKGDVVVKGQGVPDRPGRRKKEEKQYEDAYYGKLSTGARILRYIVTVILLVFAIGMAFFYRSEITAENFGLLFRNASFSFPGERKSFETVRYDADLQMDFAMYKEYFSVATTTCMRMYDHRGNVVLSEDCRMKNPRFSKGKNYLMVYDKEGKNYFICNSVAVLKEEESDRTIHDAYMSDQGSYLVMTSSSQHLAVISVYNRSFNLRTTLSFDRYPQKAALSSDGNTLLFLSYGTDPAGEPAGCVSFFDLSAQPTEKIAEYVYDDIPISCVMTEKGAAVQFAERAVFYDLEKGRTSEYRFEDGTPAKTRLSPARLALLFEKNKVTCENTIVLIDACSGRKLQTISYTGRVRNLWLENDCLIVAESGKLSIRFFDTGKERTVETELPADVISDDGVFFLCYTNKAENIRARLRAAEDGAEKENA